MASETSFFDGLRDAMAEGLDALRKGSVLTTRDVSLPPAPRPMSPAQIMRLRRDKLHVSQALFCPAYQYGRANSSGVGAGPDKALWLRTQGASPR